MTSFWICWLPLDFQILIFPLVFSLLLKNGSSEKFMMTFLSKMSSLGSAALLVFLTFYALVRVLEVEPIMFLVKRNTTTELEIALS